MFTRAGSIWSQQAYLKASNSDEDDQFGRLVAIDGDTVVIGTFLEASDATGVDGDGDDNSLEGAGAAYVFHRDGECWSQQAYLKASNTAYSDGFGSAVTISGDTLMVGAYHEESNATGVDGNQLNNSLVGSGAAYVFARTGGVWNQQAYIKATNTDAEDTMGEAIIAISGNTVLVGAMGEDSSATGVNGLQSDNSSSYSGAAYVTKSYFYGSFLPLIIRP